MPLPDAAEPSSNPPPASTEKLADTITELAAHITAATYRLLVLIAEFDRRQAWATPGMASCAHWLNWQCGITLGAAREKVRVARALESLPLISGSFERGQVSYSKVRAMTRVATPENESYLLMIAGHGTATHVEQVVRAVKRVDRVEALLQANQNHARRELTWYQNDDGYFVIKGRLPADEGALVAKALECARDELFHERAGASPTPAHMEENLALASRADALVRVAEQALAREAGKSSGGDRYLLNIHADAHVLSANGCKGEGFLDQGVRVAAETCLRLACDCGVVGREAGVRSPRVDTDVDTDPGTDTDTAQGQEPACRHTPHRSAPIPPGATSTGTDGTLIGHGHGPDFDFGRKTRSIPPALRRALKRRDGGCRFPGCTAHRHTDAHHIVHWAHGGETRLSNLITLCRSHHRLVHEGRFSVQSLDPEGHFEFRDRVGRPVPVAPPTRFRGNVLAMLTAQRRLGIAPNALVPDWDGVTMDLDMAVAGVRGSWRHGPGQA